MSDPADPGAEGEDGKGVGPQKQMPFCRDKRTSRRTVWVILRGLLKTVVKVGTSAARSLFSRNPLQTKVIPARSPTILALALVVVVLIFRPIALPGNGSDRLDAIETAVKNIEMRLAAPGVSRTEAANPTTLLVAIQFVTTAAERSTPFDTALAVAISMAGEHPRIGPLLDQLLIDAAGGVPSREELRAELQAKLAEFEQEGFLGKLGSIINAPSLPLGGLLGLGGAEITADHQTIMQKLAADTSGKNLGQAVQLMAKLDGPLREGLESWREKAQRRVVIDAVLTELRRAAFIDIIEESS